MYVPLYLQHGVRNELLLCTVQSDSAMFFLANSTGTDEMPHCVAFYLDCQCLPNNMNPDQTAPKGAV